MPWFSASFFLGVGPFITIAAGSEEFWHLFRDDSLSFRTLFGLGGLGLY